MHSDHCYDRGQSILQYLQLKVVIFHCRITRRRCNLCQTKAEVEIHIFVAIGLLMEDSTMASQIYTEFNGFLTVKLVKIDQHFCQTRHAPVG